MNTSEPLEDSKITEYKIDTKRIIEKFMTEIEQKIGKKIEIENEKIFNSVDDICDSIQCKINLIDSQEQKTKEQEDFKKARSTFDLKTIIISSLYEKQIILIYETLL